MLAEAVKTLLNDADLRRAVLAYLKANTPDKEPAWKEIYSLNTGENFHTAYWNSEFNVCVLVVRPFRRYHMENFSQEQQKSMPLSRAAQVFTDYTKAIEWAQIRLPEMWQAWEEWKTNNISV